MKSRLILTSVLTALLLASPLGAEPNASTTVSVGERYEIIQSSLAARWTFRLDRFCGSVSQLVSAANDRVAWQSLPVEGAPACTMDGRPHYQIFTSGLAARHTFLMNTATGRAWQLVTSESGEVSWQRFAD